MRDSCTVTTLDGRRLELCSEQGANDFIALNHPFNFFSVNLNIAATIYKRVAKRSFKSVKAAEKKTSSFKSNLQEEIRVVILYKISCRDEMDGKNFHRDEAGS